MVRVLICLLLLSGPATAALRADETVRQVQEELRKRNLYFGNVDGNPSPELEGALKRYQSRKGFPVTGDVNEETATSLHIQSATVASTQALPDVPVLKSDTARDLPESQRLALQKEAEESPDLTPNPPAESPAPSQDLSPERVTKFVQDYLRDGAGPDLAAQLRYYAFPVEYFDHGSVSEQFVGKDTSSYLRRWPERKYTLETPINFYASDKEGETKIEFTIAFDLRSDQRTTKKTAKGRTKNWWTVRSDGQDLKIVAIREQRLRE